MEGIVVIGVLIAAWVFFLPLIALVKASRARSEADALRLLVTDLENRVVELTLIRQGLAADGKPAVASTTRAALVEPTPTRAFPPEALPATLPEPVPEPMPTASLPEASLPMSAVHVPPASVPMAAASVPPMAAASVPLEAPSVPPAAPSVPPAPLPASSAPDPSVAPLVTPPPPKPDRGTLEETIALVWFTRIGAVAVLLGLAYFFKYAIDNEWIGPWGRVAIGALVGVLTLVIAERSRPRTRPAWTQVMLGVGIGCLLLVSYASHAFYALVPTEAAFGAFFVICCLGGVLAVRDRAPSTLIISLCAALAAPVLLSTGVDRAAGLFLYLLLVSVLAFRACFATPLTVGFRLALWLAVLGPVVLFLGWYQRFFDLHPAWVMEGERMPAGAYADWTTRLVPLAAVVAFAAAWSICQLRLRRRGHQTEATVLLLVAAVVAHAGFTALLTDHVHALALAMAGLALPFIWLFRRDGRTDLLALPLLTAFGLLAHTLHGQDTRPAPSALGALGVWALAYVITMGRRKADDRKADDRKGADRKAEDGSTPGAWWAAPAFQLGLVATAFAVFGVVLLREAHPLSLTLLVGALSAAFVAWALAQHVWRPALVLALFVSAVFWLFLPAPGPWEPTLVALLGGWAVVYLAAVAFLIFVRRNPATPALVAVSSLAGLGFLALAWLHGAGEHDLIVATLFATVGAIDLAFAAGVMRTRQGRDATDVWLAQALGLFATALGFLLAGPALTFAWAALAAVVVVLGSQRRDERWLLGGCLLFGVTAIRLVAIDAMVPVHEAEIFLATSGQHGALVPRFLLNSRVYATVAFAAACFVAAHFAARKQRPGRSGETAEGPSTASTAPGAPDALFKGAAALLVTCAHAALLILAVFEARTFVTPLLARPPADAEMELWSLYVARQLEAVAAIHEHLSTMPTLVMGLYAALLLTLGFGAREILHRYLGLAVFALAVVKLALWDVWNLSRVHQILVLVAMGALLLGASYLYARWGRRLVAALLLPDATPDRPSDAPRAVTPPGPSSPLPPPSSPSSPSQA